jgi:hypothetical protein
VKKALESQCVAIKREGDRLRVVGSIRVFRDLHMELAREGLSAACLDTLRTTRLESDAGVMLLTEGGADLAASNDPVAELMHADAFNIKIVDGPGVKVKLLP